MEFEIGMILTIVGIILLFLSTYHSLRIIRILRINYYEVSRWFVVIALLLGFVAGYGLLVSTQASYIAIPVDPLFVVAIVYFFGAIFTVVTIATVRSMLTSILGSEISSKKAEEIFREYTNIDDSQVNTTQVFSFVCETCERSVNYTVADIVRSNIIALDRGIAVEEIFGTKSFILRPTHRCINGRREYNIVHDKDLEIRSIESSRIIYGGQL